MFTWYAQGLLMYTGAIDSLLLLRANSYYKSMHALISFIELHATLDFQMLLFPCRWIELYWYSELSWIDLHKISWSCCKQKANPLNFFRCMFSILHASLLTSASTIDHRTKGRTQRLIVWRYENIFVIPTKHMEERAGSVDHPLYAIGNHSMAFLGFKGYANVIHTSFFYLLLLSQYAPKKTKGILGTP